MTVGELIETLKQFPPELLVLANIENFYYTDDCGVGMGRFMRDPSCPSQIDRCYPESTGWCNAFDAVVVDWGEGEKVGQHA